MAVDYLFLSALQLLHLLFNALALWMFGSQIGERLGIEEFLEFYFFCTVAAAFTTVAVSYMHMPGTLSVDSRQLGRRAGFTACWWRSA